MRCMPSPLDRTLGAAELSALASGLAARPELWRRHVRADPDRRCFHPLLREPHATVWLISWMPGHDTGFHDHDGAAGAVAVVRGRVCEERLCLGGAPRRSEHGAGEVFGFAGDDIHRVVHVAGEPAVTIHAYSPELRRMGAYDVGPDGILRRRALDEDVELRPTAPAAAAPA
jgi:predicted metal-dependent enzyme (double-stranded beta helix superfamily)